MTGRGSYGFVVADDRKSLVDSTVNLEKLQRLFRDGDIIGRNWGPGAPRDFDNGSWHILCHLAGASGVLTTESGRACCGITHVSTTDRYQATITFGQADRVSTLELSSAAGSRLADRADRLGFIEGSSRGHISARGIRDAPDAFNGWQRQRFDKDVSSGENGGTVWEHWATTRDIRPSSAVGTSVLRAYLTLVSVLGGRFVAAVARGRRQYSHPTQLAALVRAGVVSTEEATWDTTPEPIPQGVQDLLYEARPADALTASESLPFTAGAQRYFMFSRGIGEWSRAVDVRRDLGQ